METKLSMILNGGGGTFNVSFHANFSFAHLGLQYSNKRYKLEVSYFFSAAKGKHVKLLKVHISLSSSFAFSNWSAC